MTPEFKKQMDRIRGARMKLSGQHPFFADLAFSFPIKIEPALNPPTAATDGGTIWLHPDLVDSLSDPELQFILSHEVLHPALMHNQRLMGRDLKRWNVACDIVVNQLLVDNNVGKAPNWVIQDYYAYHKGGGKVEAIYDLLPENKCCDPGTGNSGNYASLDHVMEFKGNPEDHAASMRNKLHQAAATAKKAGKLSGSIEAFIEQATTAKVPWQEKLRAFVTTAMNDDRTWAKPNRRYQATDIYLPGRDGERMGVIVVAPDCSGSTSDQMLSQVSAEVRSIQEELRPEKIHVIYWDTAIKKHDEFEADDPIEVSVYGRGGTDPRCLFEYLEKEGIEPDCVIVPTDLYFGGDNSFGPKPNYPVMWTILDGGSDHAPWGEVLKVS